MIFGVWSFGGGRCSVRYDKNFAFPAVREIACNRSNLVKLYSLARRHMHLSKPIHRSIQTWRSKIFIYMSCILSWWSRWKMKWLPPHVPPPLGGGNTTMFWRWHIWILLGIISPFLGFFGIRYIYIYIYVTYIYINIERETPKIPINLRICPIMLYATFLLMLMA